VKKDKNKMPFLIDATDKPNSGDLRTRTRPEHMEFLKASLPKLLAAGAKLSDDGATALGSAYIVDVDTRAEAEAFINADPFSKAGLFGTITITRWRKGFFDFKAL
jgi:uncharacterized protein YciI